MDVLQLDIEDEQEVLARVAAIDVAKATGMVCTRVPHENMPGRRFSVERATRIELAWSVWKVGYFGGHNRRSEAYRGLRWPPQDRHRT